MNNNDEKKEEIVVEREFGGEDLVQIYVELVAKKIQESINQS